MSRDTQCRVHQWRLAMKPRRIDVGAGICQSRSFGNVFADHRAFEGRSSLLSWVTPPDEIVEAERDAASDCGHQNDGAVCAPLPVVVGRRQTIQTGRPEFG